MAKGTRAGQWPSYYAGLRRDYAGDHSLMRTYISMSKWMATRGMAGDYSLMNTLISISKWVARGMAGDQYLMKTLISISKWWPEAWLETILL